MRGGEIVSEMPLHAPDGFGRILYGQIEQLLESEDVGLGDIGRFAAASGPGSFTGVRIGLACAKGLAEALGKPLVAVSNLEAIAWFGTRALRAPLLDARRGEVYGAVYDSSGKLVRPEVVARLQDWIATLPAGAEVLSTEPARFAGAIPEITPVPRALAAAIGRIAASRPGEDPAAIDANYVRRSDAELFWKE